MSRKVISYLVFYEENITESTTANLIRKYFGFFKSLRPYLPPPA